MTKDKKQKVIFWAFTIPVVALMLMSGISLAIHMPLNVDMLISLGYPPYFLTILGVAKILGCAALVYRRFKTLTEWAYAGFTFTFLGASFSHFFSGDDAIKIIMPFLVLALLAGSYHFGKKI